MKHLIICLSVFVLNACTNYLYQGKITAEDSNGKNREAIIFWTKLSPLIGDDKAGPAHLHTACGSLVTFDEQEKGIFFRAEPGRDLLAVDQAPVKNGDICGKFLNVIRFVDFEGENLEVSILCTPAESDEFNLSQRTYLSAQNSPYTFRITETQAWSFMGEPPKAPPIPYCPDD